MQAKSLLAIAILLIAGVAHAHEHRKVTVVVDQAHARASVPGQRNGAAYIQIDNKGKADEVLLSASSPVAASVEIHNMTMDGDVMQMRSVENLEIKAGSQLTMKAGDGYHLMLLGLKQPLKAGAKFPLTLQFSKAGKVQVSVQVGDKAGNSDNMHEHHNH